MGVCGKIQKSGTYHKNRKKELGTQRDIETAVSAERVKKEISASKKPTTELMFHALNPKNVFKRISGFKGSELLNYYTQLEDGQKKELTFKMQMNKKFQPFIDGNKKVFDKWNGKNAEFIDTGIEQNGKNLEITPAMRIMMYLHSLNDTNTQHIINGGLKVPDKNLYKKGRYSDAYAQGETFRLSKQQIDKITGGMTQQEKTFADIAYKVFNNDFRNAINETSLILDGYEKAQVKNYAPISIDNDFDTNLEQNSLIRNGTVEGIGLLKQREKNSLPIRLEDITSTVLRQIEQVSKYYGMAIPIRNFNNMYNSTTDSGDAVKTEIRKKFGNTAANYINKLMTDLQFPKRDSDFMDKLRGNFAQAVLSVNPRVALQQPTSYLMASAYLDWNSLLKGLNPAKKVSKELISKYSSTYWYRSQGNATQELADVTKNQAEWQKKIPFLMNWIQSSDEWTLRRLWVASEAETAKKNPRLKYGADEFYKEVGKKYDETIYNSQSNNMTLQKAGYLRTHNKLYQAINMFQNQRSQNFNMVYESWFELQEVKKSYNSDKTKENEKKLQEAGTRFTNTVTGLAGSAALIAGTNLLVAFLSSSMGDYEDEEKKEVTAKSLINGYFKDFIATNFGSLPMGDIIFNVADSVATGKNFDPARYGGIQAPNIKMMNDLLLQSLNFGKAIKEVGGVSGDLFVNGEIKAIVPKAYESLAKPIKDLALTVSQMAGIPFKNSEKYIIGLAETALKVTGQDFSIKTSYEETFSKKTVSDLKYTNKDRLKATFNSVADNNARLGIAVKDELYRLYFPERDTKVIPKEPPTYFEVNGQTKQLTPSKQEKFKRSYKSTVEKNLPELINSAYYKNSSDTDKVKCISDLYSYASALAKTEISEYSITDTWYNKAQTISSIVPIETYISYKNKFKDITENAEKRKLLFADTNLTAAQKSALDENLVSKDKPVDYSSKGAFELSQQSASKQEKYTDELAKKISKEKYTQAIDTVRNVEGLKDNNGNSIQNSYSLLLRETIDSMVGYTLDEKKALYEPLGVSASVIEMPPQKFRFELQQAKWKAKRSG